MSVRCAEDVFSRSFFATHSGHVYGFFLCPGLQPRVYWMGRGVRVPSARETLRVTYLAAGVRRVLWGFEAGGCLVVLETWLERCRVTVKFR